MVWIEFNRQIHLTFFYWWWMMMIYSNRKRWILVYVGNDVLCVSVYCTYTIGIRTRTVRTHTHTQTFSMHFSKCICEENRSGWTSKVNSTKAARSLLTDIRIISSAKTYSFGVVILMWDRSRYTLLTAYEKFHQKVESSIWFVESSDIRVFRATPMHYIVYFLSFLGMNTNRLIMIKYNRYNVRIFEWMT